MWVKICGTTSLADARLAVDAGADALGFIFAPSPRRVSVEQVANITARLPRTVETYGVFTGAGVDEVIETVKGAELTGVQLHASPQPGMALGLREHFADIPGRQRLGILQVLHYSDAAGLDQALAPLREDHAVDAVLIDSRTAALAGGTGICFDWAQASAAFRRTAPHLRLLTAGGLTPENVTEAITMLRPWGVDVVSGVEAEPGRKDGSRVRAFVAAARRAAAALPAWRG